MRLNAWDQRLLDQETAASIDSHARDAARRAALAKEDTMGMFGWSLPPGCGTLPGEEDEGPCAVCARPFDVCLCPECPVCGIPGEMRCYGDFAEDNHGHGLLMSPEQRTARDKAEAEDKAERLREDAAWQELQEIEAQAALYFANPRKE